MSSWSCNAVKLKFDGGGGGWDDDGSGSSKEGRKEKEKEKEEEEWVWSAHPQQPIYHRRRRPPPPPPPNLATLKDLHCNEKRPPRPSLAANRPSFNRSLSIRGRISIAVAARVEDHKQDHQPRRKGKPPVPKGKPVQPPNFDKERQYFQEVDASELLEESPSPKHTTWATGVQNDTTPAVPLSNVCSRLEKWLISKKLNYSCGPSSTLSKILETPRVSMPLDTIYGKSAQVINLETTTVRSNLKTNKDTHSVHGRINSYLLSKLVPSKDFNLDKKCSLLGNLQDDGCEDIQVEVGKLSLASTSSSLEYVDPLPTLLAVCGQSVPSTLLDVLSKYCDPEGIVKVGEGTYGEAFKAGNTVCKIVPFDGDQRVNGEIQKRSEELLEEVVLSRTLNHLRGPNSDAHNACTTFIETLDLKVCQGPYSHALIRAWEEWDEKHGSENDHPKGFLEKQRYVVFVLQHGGKDLEGFVLKNFEEARSLLVQVTSALAVGEAAFEFEHRDLHWGNILLNRNEAAEIQFTLEGKQMAIRTHGLVASIIDFTLSRINTGEDILFLDLSSDPDLFKGPKGDRQAETYRKMKDVTQDSWERSIPRTNVLWLLYLVDILLVKKSFERSSKDERDLRSLKKRLDKYNSAKETIFDPFFSDLLADHVI